MTELDEKLIRQIGRHPRGGSTPLLTLGERVAINLLYRKGVHMNVLVRVFGVQKNALYGNAITGGGSYVSGRRGIETNELIDRIGVEAAYRQYVTPEMTRAINAEMRRFLAERNAA